MRRLLARLLRRWGDWLEPPPPPTELADGLALIQIEQRQAMREGMKAAMRAAMATGRAELTPSEVRLYKPASPDLEPGEGLLLRLDGMEAHDLECTDPVCDVTELHLHVKVKADETPPR